MTIKYIAEGDKFKASQLWGEARHQLSILKNAMSFQNLQQLQKIVRFNDGTIIKCISCFGQDVVKVFVPQQAEGIKYREDIRIRYMPAMIVYDAKYGGKYLGVVLCKGGGFEPPYEFVPRKERLPYDLSDEEPEILPGERTWFYPNENRRLDDIPPKGIAAVDAEWEQTIPNKVTYSGGFVDVLTNTCQWVVCGGGLCCPRYCAKSAWHYAYTRTQNARSEYSFTSEVLPGHFLNFGEDFYVTEQGSGSNEFVSNPAWLQPRCQDSFDWVNHKCDESVNFDLVIALTEDELAGVGEPPEVIFTSLSNFCGPFIRHDYSYLEDTYKPWAWYSQFGSVMDENHYALVYSLKHDIYKRVYHKSIADLRLCIDANCGYAEDCASPRDLTTTYEQTEGPLSVVVDGVVFELFPEAALEVSPRLERHCNLKYFRVGEKGIGLFHIGKNYSEPYDWMYVYAGVTPKGNKVIVTEMSERYAEVPGVTDSDGNPVYTHGGLRLIRETITEEREIVGA